MSKDVSPSIAGSKPTSFQNANSSSLQSAPPTAEDRLNGWYASLSTTAVADMDAAAALFELVAQGFSPPADAAKAQAVFNDLIQHEAYDLFVEVFTAYNDVRAAQARAPGEPAFKRSLTLQMPADWAPASPEAFRSALERVQIDRLEVVHPHVDASKFGPLTSPSEQASWSSLMSFQGPKKVDPKEAALAAKNRARFDEAHNTAVPASVCDAIVTRLKAGTPELVVRGRLEKPAEVADEMQKNLLRSVELGHESRSPSTATLDSYATLMQGMAKCPTLEHLCLTQTYVLGLHKNIQNLPQCCLDLKSVHLKLNGFVHAKATDLESFVKIAAGCRLEEIRIEEVPKGTLVNDIFVPLEKHPTLTKLDLVVSLATGISKEDWKTFPAITRLSKSCPTLKHLDMRGPALGPNQQDSSGAIKRFSFVFPAALRDYRSMDEEMTTEFVSDPAIHLESITLFDLPLLPQFLSAVFQTLQNNQTIKHLDFSTCVVGVKPALELPEWLNTNQTLQTAKLPADAFSYFVEGNNDRLHLLAGNFSLPNDAGERAEAAFEAIAPIAHTAPTAAQNLLDRKQKAAASEVLAQSLGGLLQMAAPPGLQSTAFNDIARGIVPYVAGDAKALREAVHWSEVGNRADPQRLHNGANTDENVKAVVTAANANAVANNLPTAPLAVNTVDAQRGNKQLREAVKNDDPEAVLDLKSKDAIDFRGLAKRDAKSKKVVDALQSPTGRVPDAGPSDGTGQPKQG